MNSLLAIHIFSLRALYLHMLLTFFYDDDVGKSVRCTGEMVAIEIYVHKHSFLSLQLLTENWYFAISPVSTYSRIRRSQKKRKLQGKQRKKIECGSLKGMSNIKDEMRRFFSKSN